MVYVFEDSLYYLPSSSSEFCSVAMNLQQVVHHTIQFPLRIHLRPAAECEAIQADVTQMAKHRFHRPLFG